MTPTSWPELENARRRLIAAACLHASMEDVIERGVVSLDAPIVKELADERLQELKVAARRYLTEVCFPTTATP